MVKHSNIKLSLHDARKVLFDKRKNSRFWNKEDLEDFINHGLPTNYLVKKYGNCFIFYKQSKSKNGKTIIETHLKNFKKKIRCNEFNFDYLIDDGLLSKPYTNQLPIYDCIYFWIYKNYIIKIGKTNSAAFQNRIKTHLTQSKEEYFLSGNNNVVAPNHSNISNIIARMFNANIIKGQLNSDGLKHNIKRIDLFIKPKHKNKRLLTDIENYFHTKIMPFHEKHLNDNLDVYFKEVKATSRILAFKSPKIYRKYLRKQGV